MQQLELEQFSHQRRWNGFTLIQQWFDLLTDFKELRWFCRSCPFTLTPSGGSLSKFLNLEERETTPTFLSQNKSATLLLPSLQAGLFAHKFGWKSFGDRASRKIGRCVEIHDIFPCLSCSRLCFQIFAFEIILISSMLPPL